MNAEDVRATLAGRKTHVRRIIKPQPPCECSYTINGNQSHALCYDTNSGIGPKTIWVPPTPKSKDHRLSCPFGAPGDELWVREAWRPVGPWECRKDGATIQYRSDGEYLRKTGWPDSFRIKTSDRRDKWYPSIHMPRWASRITLELTSVRVERLQDISEEDAEAEGIAFMRDIPDADEMLTAKQLFKILWESINGPGSWDLNPWLWVLEYNRKEEK